MESQSIRHDWAHITNNHSILRLVKWNSTPKAHSTKEALSKHLLYFSNVSSYLARAGSHTLTSMVSVTVKHNICCHATDIIWHPIISFDKGILILLFLQTKYLSLNFISLSTILLLEQCFVFVSFTFCQQGEKFLVAFSQPSEIKCVHWIVESMI